MNVIKTVKKYFNFLISEGFLLFHIQTNSEYDINLSYKNITIEIFIDSYRNIVGIVLKKNKISEYILDSKLFDKKEIEALKLSVNGIESIEKLCDIYSCFLKKNLNLLLE